MYSIDRLFLNIVDNYKSLQEDFTGFSFNLIGSVQVLANFLVATCLIILFYLLGKKIKSVFFKKENYMGLDYFINIALGYILVGTGIAILGIFSLLYVKILFFYLFILIVIALYPISTLKKKLKDIFNLIKNSPSYFSKHKWIYLGIFLFVLIILLRLIPPEIGEDAIGYHTDLPFLYLKSHTMILESKEIQHVIPIPQLGEMSYVITQSLRIKDGSRYVHFSFYILIIMLLCYIGANRKTSFLGLYSAIFFVTAPIIIRHASKANVDFQALFCWLLSVFIMTKGKKCTFSTVILSAIIFGGALSTKLWEMAFLPIFLLYILLTQKPKMYALKLCMIFLFFSLLISGIWFFRAYIITGNPLFPAFSSNASLFNFIGINKFVFSLANLVVFSPLFFMGIIFLLFRFPYKVIKLTHLTSSGLMLSKVEALKNLGLFLFFILLSLEHLFIQYYIPRYLLSLYIVGIIIVSSGLRQFVFFSRIKNYVLSVTFSVLFFYYFANTIAILPYGFGWADKNKYLTRILSKDSSSYYDFDHLFDKHIAKKDLVAVYSLSGFYYGNFTYIDTGYIFDEKNTSFDLLRKKGATKLLTRGGDIEWFCKQLKLQGCYANKYKLLVSYYPGLRFLYSINEK